MSGSTKVIRKDFFDDYKNKSIIESLLNKLKNNGQSFENLAVPFAELKFNKNVLDESQISERKSKNKDPKLKIVSSL